MKRSTLQLYKVNIILGIILILLAALLFYRYFYGHKELSAKAATSDEIIVMFNEEISDSSLQEVLLPYQDEVELKRHIEDYVLLSLTESGSAKRIMEELSENPLVSVVQENVEVSIQGFSNDTYADSQWAIYNPGYYVTISNTRRREVSSLEGIDMNILEAWEALKLSKTPKREVIVAVIDTGIDYNHPDLAENMWVNKNEIPGDNIDNDNNGYVDDIYGWDFYNNDASVCHYETKSNRKYPLANPKDNDDHGTHVAGIIGAVSNNNIGIAGIASNIKVKIMALKINGGENGTGDIASSIEAIKYATMMGASICNISWGTSFQTGALEKVIRESDMLFVAAAGNSGTDNDDQPIYPASLKLNNVISVTFIDPKGKLTKFSNYGKNSVEIAAPGEDIVSTIVGNYSTMSGSSMAAPHVSGVAAILYAYSEKLYPAEVKQLIINNLKPLPELGEAIIYPGIPNAFQAVLNYNTLSQDTIAPTLKIETKYNKDKMDISVIATDEGGSGLRVLKWIYGVKTLQDFKRGVNGTSIDSDVISVSKAGNYTFYASDYSGNESITVHEVVADTTAPKLAVTYKVSNDYKTRTVTVLADDKESGIKKVKYMEGKKKAQDFLPANTGKEVTIKDGKGSFQVKKDGIYTIFASDNRGNLSVKQVNVKTVKASKITLNQSSIILKAGYSFSLRPTLSPLGSTDVITYKSSKKSVAEVSSTGKIKAVGPGKAKITIKTSSGLSVVCEVTVVK